ncbi:unnamed protein product [Cuscuta campestris]|uniref:Uncharacterized protein n=1 Tax=Cuscuta campestris TaxID=132261 RepID=A0A484LPW9_9ASTE|nr:unnamed protein product [Cuscuta campestris]
MEICPKYGRLSNCDENDKVGEFQCCFHSRSSVRFRPLISRSLHLGNKKIMMEALPEGNESEEMQGLQANV